MLSNQSEVDQQFQQIGTPERSAVIGLEEVNKPHNRYTDIGRFPPLQT